MDLSFQSDSYTVLLALGCAWGAGLNVYGTILFLGIALRNVEGLEPPGGLALLENPWVMGAAAILTLVDLVATKHPRYDVIWNRRQGWIRIAAAVVLVFMASGAFPADVRIICAVLAGAIALAVHVGRTGAHVAMHHAGTAGFAVPLAGVVEDCLLLSMLIPLVMDRPGLTLLMIGVTAIALAMLLFLAWNECRKILWDLLLGEQKSAP